MKKAKTTKIETGKTNMLGMKKKEKVICCPHCKSIEYEILGRSTLFTSSIINNHTKGICRKCGRKFKIN